MERAGRKPKGLYPLSPSPSGSTAEEDEEDTAGPVAMASPGGVWFWGWGFFLEPVSSFPPAPHLSCYLPHHLLLLLFIVYLLNEGGGEGWGLTDSATSPYGLAGEPEAAGRPRGAAACGAGPGRAGQNPLGKSEAAPSSAACQRRRWRGRAIVCSKCIFTSKGKMLID